MILSSLSHQSYQEIAPYVDTIIVPIGSIQAHGPHLPLGTDSFIVSRLALELEQYISGRVLILPECSYGHCPDMTFPGTINIPVHILAQLLFHSVQTFSQYGAKYVVFINGNGGNLSALSQVTDMLLEKGWNTLVSNWWIDARSKIMEIAPGIGHGGEDETSLMRAIMPQFVTVDHSMNGQPYRATRFKAPGQFMTSCPDAYSGSPGQASAEKGEQILTFLRDQLLIEIQDMWKICDS